MKITSLFIRLIVLILLGIGIMTVWENWKAGNWVPKWLIGSSDTIESSHRIALQEISAMGNLELVKYNFKDVVEQKITKILLPDAKALLIIQGEAIGCIDLQKIKEGDIIVTGDTLLLHLPEPELCVFKIDHSKSKIYNTEYAFTDEAALIEKAYKQAEEQIKTSALELGILEQTKENAAKILVPILEKSTGKKVILKHSLRATLPSLG
jgi:hypothetical protein